MAVPPEAVDVWVKGTPGVLAVAVIVETPSVVQAISWNSAIVLAANNAANPVQTSATVPAVVV